MKLAKIFQNFNVGTKITSGFTLMLILLIFLAYIGFNGISKVADRVNKVNDINLLVVGINECRQQEKNYIITKDESCILQVDDELQKIQDQAKTTKEKFRQIENKNKMDTIINNARYYSRVFHSYVDSETEKIKGMENMRLRSENAVKTTEEFYSQQLSQLTSDLSAELSITQIQASIDKTNDANQIIKWFLEARKNEKEYIISGEQQWYDTHDELVNNTIDLCKDLRTRLRRDIHITMADQVIIDLDLYQKEYQNFVTLMNQQKQAEENLLKIARNAETTCTEVHSYQLGKMQKQISSADSFMLIITLVSIVLAIIISYIITNSITQPLNTSVDIAERIAIGDMDINISSVDRKDELGKLSQAFFRMTGFLKEMAKKATLISEGDLRVEVKPLSEKDILGNAFLRMIEKLRNQNKEVMEAVNVLTSMVTEISATTSQLSSSSQETATAVSETSTTIEEVKQTAELASKKAKDISENAKQTIDVAKKGKEAVEGTSRGIERISDQMNLIASSIMKLSEQSQTIGEITSSINDLAEQSNLLAVNASIEAVKAGEEGKGFSVVAEEIRSLAEQSKQATKQVREVIADVQKATSAAVMAIEEGSKAVGAGQKQSAEAGNAIEIFADALDETVQATIQIGTSTQQQFTGIEQVNEAVRNISTASTQNLESSKQLETAAGNLDELGQNLKKLMEMYKL